MTFNTVTPAAFSYPSSCIFDWISAFFKTSRLARCGLNEQKKICIRHLQQTQYTVVLVRCIWHISGPSNFVDIIIWIDSQSDMPIRSIQRYLKGLSLRYLLWQLEHSHSKKPRYMQLFYFHSKRFFGIHEYSVWKSLKKISFLKECVQSLIFLCYLHTNLGIRNESLL